MSKTINKLNGDVCTYRTLIKTFTFINLTDAESSESIDATVNKFIKQVQDNDGTIYNIIVTSMIENGYFHHNYVIHYGDWVSEKEPKTKKTTKKKAK